MTRPLYLPATAILLSAVCAAPAAQAQGWLSESVPWQFQTSADRANRAIVNDMVEKKKGGYYDAFNPTYITNIERQVNCNFQPTSAGNSSSADQAARVASPDVTATTGNSASSTGSAYDSTSSTGRNGTSTSSSTQSNTGAISSGVDGSASTTTLAPINSENSQGQQDMQVAQTNSGSQSTSVSGSSACLFSGSGAIN